MSNLRNIKIKQNIKKIKKKITVTITENKGDFIIIEELSPRYEEDKALINSESLVLNNRKSLTSTKILIFSSCEIEVKYLETV